MDKLNFIKIKNDFCFIKAYMKKMGGKKTDQKYLPTTYLTKD